MGKKKQYHLYCLICGEEFISKSPSGLYCSEECKLMAEAERKGMTYKQRHKISENMEWIRDIANEAAELGMSYGEYVKKRGLS